MENNPTPHEGDVGTEADPEAEARHTEGMEEDMAEEGRMEQGIENMHETKTDEHEKNTENTKEQNSDSATSNILPSATDTAPDSGINSAPNSVPNTAPVTSSSMTGKPAAYKRKLLSVMVSPESDEEFSGLGQEGKDKSAQEATV